MGAGSSARKLKAEKAAREEAERKALAELQSRLDMEKKMQEAAERSRKLEEELDVLRRELGKIRLNSPGSSSSQSSCPWTPCRLKKQLTDQFELKEVIVHHDGENCYIPNHPDFRYGSVRDHVATMIASLHCTLDPEIIKARMEYFFYLNRKERNPFHPHLNYWNDMDSLGVHLEAVGSKKGAVDTKLKLRLNLLSQEDGSNRIVVLITGDKDFIAELLNLGKSGFYVVLVHRNNITSTRVIEESCHVAFDCWEKILVASHPHLSIHQNFVRVSHDKSRAVVMEASRSFDKRVRVRLIHEEEEDHFLSVMGATDVVSTCEQLKQIAETIVVMRFDMSQSERKHVVSLCQDEPWRRRFEKSNAVCIELLHKEAKVGETSESLEETAAVSGLQCNVERAVKKLMALSKSGEQERGSNGHSPATGESSVRNRRSQSREVELDADQGMEANPTPTKLFSKDSPVLDINGLFDPSRIRRLPPEKADGQDPVIKKEMQVPASLIGPVIIGRKHMKLRSLEAGTGTSIFVPRKGDCGEELQRLVVSGDHEEVSGI
mmetsp:Transcript_49867/g.156068  ORF Transcript_49867/g.156068 Transcript_49867/m.156068 type:complete len:548 (-) Transcript_49867:57-1700(-)